jgi:hypothetical protein
LPTKNLTMSSKTKRQREERRRENKKVNKHELYIGDKIKRIKVRCTVAAVENSDTLTTPNF